MDRQDQKLFQRALQEVESKMYLPAVLRQAKADVETEDPEKINARYLQLRFEQLKSQFADLLEEKRKAKAADAKNVQRVEEDQSREKEFNRQQKKKERAREGMNDYLCLAIVFVVLTIGLFAFGSMADKPGDQSGEASETTAP